MLLLFLLLLSIEAEEVLSDRLLLDLESSQRRLSASGTGLEPQDGLLVFIYNEKYRWTRLAHWSNGNTCRFYDGTVRERHLWQLKEDTPGNYWLINKSFGDRFAYNGRSFCYDGSYHDDQLWNFERIDTDRFIIKNVEHPNCHLALWGRTSGGVYCRRAGAYDNGSAYFRLVSPFTSVAAWATVDEFNNTSEQTVPRTFKFKKGITSTFSETTAQSTTSSTSLTLSAEGAVGNALLGASWTTSFERTFSHSVTKARQEVYEEETEIKYDILPNAHKCLQQLQITTTDSVTNKSFVYESPTRQFVDC